MTDVPESPAGSEPPPRRNRAADYAMILAQIVVGLFGVGLAGLATFACVAVVREEMAAPAGRPTTPWWGFVLLALLMAAAWFIPIACAVGIYRRARPAPPPGDPLAPRRRFARRLRGLALAAISAVLALFCLLVAYSVLNLWWADRFRQLPRLVGLWYFWLGVGCYSLTTLASVLGVWSGARRMLRPPPEEGAEPLCGGSRG